MLGERYMWVENGTDSGGVIFRGGVAVKAAQAFEKFLGWSVSHVETYIDFWEWSSVWLEKNPQNIDRVKKSIF